MARIRFREFLGGLFPSGPQEMIPRGALRRARGIWPVRNASLRSRGGTQLLDTLPAPASTMPAARFGGVRYYAAGTQIIKSPAAVLASGLDGTRVQFVTAPPSDGLPDHLYAAGGGRVRAVAPSVREWGIAPPPDGQTAGVLNLPKTRLIQACDAIDFWFRPIDSPLSVDPFVSTDGNGSLTAVIPSATTAKFGYDELFIDLNEFSAGALDSPDEDWIQLALRFDKPRRIDQIEISFIKFANSNFGWVFQIVMDDDVSNKRRRGRKRRGLADHVAVQNNEVQFMASTPGLPLRIAISQLLGDDRASPNDNAWAILRIPKASFSPMGDPVDWTDIQGVHLTIVTNSLGKEDTQVWFDDIRLIGGTGMQGDYQYLFTNRNSSLNIRSNPNQTPLVVQKAQRQPIRLTINPGFLSPDPQVDQIEIWRTFGNGAVFFLDQRVPKVAGNVVDSVADYQGLHSETSSYLQTEVLPLDNVKPFNSFIDAAGPHYGRMFWIDQLSNKVYYSPAGRPESVAGFLTPVGTDNPAFKLVVWNDAVWLFTRDDIFQIAGTTEPFVALRVPAHRGTTSARSVVATDTGIFFRAIDGLRVFDGVRTHLLGPDSFGQLYYGEPASNLLPIAPPPNCACWTGEEFIFTDSVQTLAWNTREGMWVRDFGKGFSMVAYERDTGFLIVGFSDGRVGRIDAPGVFTDLGDPIPFDVKPSAYVVRTAERNLVQRCYVELTTHNQELTPIIEIDGIETVLDKVKTVDGIQRPIELPITKPGTVFAVRFTGQLLLGPVEIVAIEWDVPNLTAEQEA